MKSSTCNKFHIPESRVLDICSTYEQMLSDGLPKIKGCLRTGFIRNGAIRYKWNVYSRALPLLTVSVSWPSIVGHCNVNTKVNFPVSVRAREVCWEVGPRRACALRPFLFQTHSPVLQCILFPNSIMQVWKHVLSESIYRGSSCSPRCKQTSHGAHTVSNYRDLFRCLLVIFQAT
jgi:hypothetical protein